MAIINVSTAAQLSAAINNARAGDTIQLASGNYGTLNLDGARNGNVRFGGEVTITSANPGSPAEFNSVNLRMTSNITLDNIDFTMVAGRSPGDSLVRIDQSNGITIENAYFDGRSIGGVNHGLRVSASNDVTVQSSEFDHFYYGATFGHTSNLRVLNNDVHSMEFDGLRFSQITNGLIQGNHLHDMDGTANGGHRDMIQFWTQGDSAPSTNVTIRDNDIMMGDGRASQSIFIFNEAVSRNGAGANMYYRNFVIENNHIQNAHPNGITVGEIDGLVIRNNTVVKDPDTRYFSHGFEPRIIVDDDARNVTVTGNITHGVPGFEPGWVISNNRLVSTGYQPGSPTPAPDPAGPTPSPSPSPGGLTGGPGNDVLTSTAAADTIVGAAGNDTLRGLAGNDRLIGGAGRDLLTGGTGGDVFDFNFASESVGWARDVIRAGDGAAAFEGVGWAAGDRIDLSGIDANVHAAGNQMFGFGGPGTGRVSVVDMGSSTLVRANTDYDAAFEFELVIEDGGVRAAQYLAPDFIL